MTDTHRKPYKLLLTLFSMEKLVKIQNGMYIISFDPEDRKIHEIEEGDILELTITKIQKNKKEDTKKKNDR